MWNSNWLSGNLEEHSCYLPCVDVCVGVCVITAVVGVGPGIGTLQFAACSPLCLLVIYEDRLSLVFR